MAGYEVRDLGRRWRLAIDLDSPLDVALIGKGNESLARVAAVAADRRAELLVAGRTSATTMRWLERNVAARVRVLAEERGLRASSPLALRGEGAQRPPRSVLGLVLDRDGPRALGATVAELADAALIDSRVLLAHRFGADEARWPATEDGPDRLPIHGCASSPNPPAPRPSRSSLGVTRWWDPAFDWRFGCHDAVRARAAARRGTDARRRR
ncbi:MAG: hypothetical protein E6I65_08340 [Chloroflexi bacterium]|nr:MAG: hypothetical protein E6I65_08340 [Chloroflexota bacterium]